MKNIKIKQGSVVWFLTLIIACLFLVSYVNAQTQNFNYTGTIQSYTVPPGVTSINIEVFGAQGKSAQSNRIGGLGAKMSGDFSVTPGSQLLILVGGEGIILGGHSGGGGGGTFVVLVDPTSADVITAGPYAGTKVKPLIIAGGGGGTRVSANVDGRPGVVSQNGTTGSCSDLNGVGSGLISSAPLGLGGSATCASWGSGGGGYKGNGGNDSPYGTGGISFLNGGNGGINACSSGGQGGGFGSGGSGGGCAGGGGGGGFTGGQGGFIAGGGGSYNVGTNQINSSGVRSGNGFAAITTETVCDISLVSHSTYVSCLDGSNGSIDLEVSTTAPPFIVSWTGPNGYTASTEDISGLMAGNYSVTVTDNNSCVKSIIVTVFTEPDVTNPSIVNLPTDVNQGNDPGLCGAVVNWVAPTASDNCSASIAQTAGPSSGSTFPVGMTTITYTATDVSGNNVSESFTITITDTEAPSIVDLPANVNQGNDPGVCGAVVNWVAPTASDNCSATIVQTAGQASGSNFPVGMTTITYSATDSTGNSVSESFTITITDTEAPVIVGLPANVNQSNDPGDCGAVVNWVAPTASDNCSATIVQTTGPASGSTFPVGMTTITYSATDSTGNSVSESFTITITDNEAPEITTNGDQTSSSDAGICGALVHVSAVATDNCGVGLPSGVRSDGLALNAAYPVGSTTITWSVTDVNGNADTETQTVTVTNDAPFIYSVTSSDADGSFEVGTPVSLTLMHVDDNEIEAKINWDDGSIQMVSNPEDTITVSHTYSSAGMYSVTLSVTDACGLTTSYIFNLIAYDPNGGFVTGGGWIDSPPNSYVANPRLTGKANFGFVCKYLKGATVPTGNTEFQFKAGNLNFNSTSYQWLIVSGNKAQYQGVGTINGTGNYKFLVTAIDGDKKPDKFRIRITDSSNGLIYDNMRGAAEDSDAGTIIGGGSIVIHDSKSGNSSARSGNSSDAGEKVVVETIFDASSVNVYPMPFKDRFYIYVPGPIQESLYVQMFDINGKELFRKTGTTNTNIEIDANGLKSGMYLIKVLKANGLAVRKVMKE